jgi:5-deoxy-D-glucuronate isomerase
MRNLIIVLGLLMFCFVPLYAQDDPGEPDTLIYQSNVYVPYNPDEQSTAFIEVYFVTDDSIGDFSIPTTWYSSDGQIVPDSIHWCEALEGWDDTWYNILIDDEC